MSCLSLSEPPSGPSVPVSTPICSIGLSFYTAMLLINLINQSINQSITHLLLHNKGLQGLKMNTLYITNNCALSNKNEATVIKARLRWGTRSCPKVPQKYSKSTPWSTPKVLQWSTPKVLCCYNFTTKFLHSQSRSFGLGDFTSARPCRRVAISFPLSIRISKLQSEERKTNQTVSAKHKAQGGPPVRPADVQLGSLVSIKKGR